MNQDIITVVAVCSIDLPVTELKEIPEADRALWLGLISLLLAFAGGIPGILLGWLALRKSSSVQKSLGDTLPSFSEQSQTNLLAAKALGVFSIVTGGIMFLLFFFPLLLSMFI